MSKNIYILNYLLSEAFKSKINSYKHAIANKKITIDEISKNVLNEVWHINKFDFWLMNFNDTRYYLIYTQDMVNIYLQ